MTCYMDAVERKSKREERARDETGRKADGEKERVDGSKIERVSEK